MFSAVGWKSRELSRSRMLRQQYRMLLRGSPEPGDDEGEQEIRDRDFSEMHPAHRIREEWIWRQQGYDATRHGEQQAHDYRPSQTAEAEQAQHHKTDRDENRTSH